MVPLSGFNRLQVGALLVIFGVLISVNAGPSEAGWKFYAKSTFGSYYYDIENIDRLANHLVRVRQKLTLSDEGKLNLMSGLGKEYDQANEAIILREIDCVNKKSRILEVTFCSGEGRVIKKESYDSSEGDSIVPDSVDDILYGVICKSSN